MDYNASEHAARGYVVATLRGSIIDRGPISELVNFMDADTLHCHLDDEAELRRRVAELMRPQPKRRQQTIAVAARVQTRRVGQRA